MPIEVTSVPEQGWFTRTHARRVSLTRSTASNTSVRVLILLLVIATVLCSDALLRSYQYYARQIDARLAVGYLTSRPGLYAAPRTIRHGQQYSLSELAQILRRAGYVETHGSEVWNGTFSQSERAIELRPSGKAAAGRAVRISLDETNRVEGLTEDELPLDSFTLEPEILTNDVYAKGGRRRLLTFDDLPPVLVQAILSIEDRRFFDHAGVDVLAIIRAVVHNSGEGSSGQGGSTITQQLVKNTYLTPERTFKRKYAEAMLSLALERRLSKQDIFALYCSEIYLGQRGSVAARGVEEAANLYFQKDLKSLTLAEAATLAGMIQGPARYSPEKHPEAATERRNTVLNAMLREEFITKEQYTSATQQHLLVTAKQQPDSAVAPYFIDYVNRIAEKELEVSGGDSRVYTTIDLELQKIAEQSLKRQLDRLAPFYPSPDHRPQAALVALDPRTGEVLAMIGGRNYGESQLNRATDAYRQPGSTFKPFVYAAALESGMSPVRMFADSPREFTYDGNRIYRPANYGGGYSMREVTMRTGLVKSLNVVTVDVAMQTGLSRIARLAEGVGLPKPEKYPSLALGTTEVTPLQLAAAYASLVNGGQSITPRAVRSVAEPPGTHSLLDNDRVMKPTTAYMITNMLTGVIDHGTARSVRNVVKGAAVAGKTGTSRDSWFAGYTPNLVCVVWIGFDDNSQVELTGAEGALPVWAEFISEAVKVRPELGGSNFECPEGIKFVEIDVDSGLLSTLTCPRRELIAITEQASPHLECFLHGNLRQLPEVTPAVMAEEETASQRTRQSRGYEQRRVVRSTRVDIDSNGRHTLVSEPTVR
jgi:penicillin-binding protein 1B